jgi:hypothetical protein
MLCAGVRLTSTFRTPCRLQKEMLELLWHVLVELVWHLTRMITSSDTDALTPQRVMVWVLGSRATSCLRLQACCAGRQAWWGAALLLWALPAGRACCRLRLRLLLLLHPCLYPAPADPC